jgi:Ribonuclease G/E
MSETICTLSHYHSCPDCGGTGTVLSADYQSKKEEILRLKSLIQILVEAIDECAEFAKPIEHDGPWTDLEKQAYDIRSIIYEKIRALSAKTKAEEILKGDG